MVAITGRNVLGHGALTVGCDNMGVVWQGNSPQRPMLEKQPQSDVLRYFKGLMASSRIGGWMQHMYGHTDKYLLEAKMSPAQQVNCRADKLATAALIAAVEANEFNSSIFLSEKVCIEIAGEQVTGSPKNAITELWGEQIARALYDRGGVVSKDNFPFVYWEGMEHVLKLFLEMFRVWVTTHVSHFQGTNQHLSHIDKSVLMCIQVASVMTSPHPTSLDAATCDGHAFSRTWWSSWSSGCMISKRMAMWNNYSSNTYLQEGHAH
jgi:hypothetical protein